MFCFLLLETSPHKSTISFFWGGGKFAFGDQFNRKSLLLHFIFLFLKTWSSGQVFASERKITFTVTSDIILLLIVF